MKSDDTMRVAGDVRQPMHTLNIGEQTIIIVKLWSRNKVVATKTQRVRDMNNSMSSHINRNMYVRGLNRIVLNFWCVDEILNTSVINNNANHQRRLKSIHILYVIGQSFLCITPNVFHWYESDCKCHLSRDYYPFEKPCIIWTWVLLMKRALRNFLFSSE